MRVKLEKLTRVMALGCVAAALGAGGCVTAPSGGGDSGAEVVERSKEKPPAWCALDGGKLHEADAVLRYVEDQSNLLDLPLGIKQTQLTALESSKKALATAVRQRVAEAAEDSGLVVTGAGAVELERQVAQATQEAHSRLARVSDIYFERRRSDRAVSDTNPRGETFGVQVLIQLPRAGLDEAVRTVARRLSASSDGTLRRLGVVLSGGADQGSKSMSH
jgi:hypothetical protein